MLVTFHSKAWSSVTMFGDVAAKLLKMMGHSGAVPSALLADDVPSALERLKQALAVVEREERKRSGMQSDPEDPNAEPPVTIGQRAYPLIELLSAAADRHCDVMWVEGNRVV